MFVGPKKAGICFKFDFSWTPRSWHQSIPHPYCCSSCNHIL